MNRFSHFLVKNLELKSKEVGIFILLFLHSFFLGLSIAFYFVPANSEFINYYGSEQLPLAYIVSGIAGYFITSIYSFLQKRVNSQVLFLGATFFMLIVTALGRFGVSFVDPKWLSSFVFIWAWPFISLVGIVAGGLSLRFLNLVQVKRLFGLFNMGGVLAAILGYLAIPLLNKVISHSYDLLFISIAGFTVSLFLLLSMFRKYPEQVTSRKQKREKRISTTGFFTLIKQKYFLLIFVSATLSMVVIYVTDFAFLSSVKLQIEPENVSQYLALVFGALKIGELIISFFSNRLLSKYGVKLGLTILPLFSTLLIFLATLVGLLSGAESILFLVLMTLNKSFERILRRGLDDPAFNILYQPLPDNEKLSVQTKVGVVMQISIAIAGVILIAINRILVTESGFLLKYFPLFFLPILLLWVFVSRKLYLAYKANIRQILADISKEKRRDTAKYQYGTEVLKRYLKHKNQRVVNLSVTILSETNPKLLEPYATSLLANNDEIVQKAILRNIDPTWRKRIFNSIDRIYHTSESNEIRLLAERAKENLDFSDIKEIKEEEIITLKKSQYVSDKLKLVKYIQKKKIEADEELIVQLLEDNEKAVKSAAITLAGKLKTDKLIKKLVAFIRSSEYYNISGNVLLDIGDKVLPELDKYFVSNERPEVLIRVIELYAKFGSTPAKKLLIKHLSFENREIQLAIIWALYFCRYQADEQDVEVVKNKIDEVVENILWTYATLLDIEEEKNTLKLYMALDEERKFNFELLFQLLSFIYEPRIIALIQKNIIGKNTIFALEIIDNFFSQDIKQTISPLFDDITTLQKIKKLNNLFPQQRFSFQERLKDIIKRDYNKLDYWTVTKAVELLGRLHKSRVSKRSRANVMDYKDIEIWTRDKIEEVLDKIRKSEMPDEIFVCLYHPDELVYSTAAKIIHNENPIKCFDYLINMSTQKQQLMGELSNSGLILTDKVRLIKRHPMFFNVPENLLVKIAKVLRVKELKKNDELFIEHQMGEDDIIILMKGALVANVKTSYETYFFKYDIVTRGLNIDQNVKSLIAKKESTALLISRFEYFNLLVNQTEMIRQIFSEFKEESDDTDAI